MTPRLIISIIYISGLSLKLFPHLAGHTEVRYSEQKKKVISEPVKLDQEYRDFDFESPWEGTKYITKETKKNTEKK